MGFDSHAGCWFSKLSPPSLSDTATPKVVPNPGSEARLDAALGLPMF